MHQYGDVEDRCWDDVVWLLFGSAEAAKTLRHCMLSGELVTVIDVLHWLAHEFLCDHAEQLPLNRINWDDYTVPSSEQPPVPLAEVAADDCLLAEYIEGLLNL